jgi:Transposase DDE domain
MERELWEALCHLAGRLYNRSSRSRYGDDVICGVYWWAVVHDRPVSWACEARHWPESRRVRLPSQPTMSRRLRSGAVEQLFAEVEQSLLALVVIVGPQILAIDGKALPVGGPSKDADATWGRGAGGVVKGYKVHAIWGDAPLPVAYAPSALNVSERRMAAKLIRDLPGEGYLLGDKHYDVNYLYEAAAQADYQLLAPQQRPGKALGHRRHSPHRLRGLELLKTTFGKNLYRRRCRIERQFAQLTSFVGGLGPLPFWVRRFNRVRQWVHSKLLINAVHQLILRRKKLAIE